MLRSSLDIVKLIEDYFNFVSHNNISTDLQIIDVKVQLYELPPPDRIMRVFVKYWTTRSKDFTLLTIDFEKDVLINGETSDIIGKIKLELDLGLQGIPVNSTSRKLYGEDDGD